MPKLKTKKGAAKRFKLTKTGKITYKPSGKSHILTNKEPERLRTLRRSATLANQQETKYLKRLLPYG
ncbi:MAG: 50S ribosomal protein L35 [Candidatus Omnitrophica bacterium]|nr:50S ribosomal protein L35 [Candidatus Omnitrophota bacterium]